MKIILIFQIRFFKLKILERQIHFDENKKIESSFKKLLVDFY